MNDQQMPNFKTGFPLKNLPDGQPVAGKVDEDEGSTPVSCAVFEILSR